MLSSTSYSLLGALQFTQSNESYGKPFTKPEVLATRTRAKLIHRNHTLEISTTDALTAAILIYAIGAGITAAAGTRLALQ